MKQDRIILEVGMLYLRNLELEEALAELIRERGARAAAAEKPKDGRRRPGKSE